MFDITVYVSHFGTLKSESEIALWHSRLRVLRKKCQSLFFEGGQNPERLLKISLL